MPAAVFLAACAAAGLALGYLAFMAAAAALAGEQAAVRLPTGREAADFTAAVEGWLRAEGY